MPTFVVGQNVSTSTKGTMDPEGACLLTLLACQACA